MKEKYTIEVSDDLVQITGTLTIREAFDFLNFFEREGYGILEEGEYGNTLTMRKGSAEEERKAAISQETTEYIENLRSEIETAHHDNGKLKERVATLEYLVKKIGLEGTEMSERLKEANDNVAKFRALEKLKNSPEAAQICAMQGPGQEMEDLTEYGQH